MSSTSPGGEKIPRKGGPGITRSDLLVDQQDRPRALCGRLAGGDGARHQADAPRKALSFRQHEDGRGAGHDPRFHHPARRSRGGGWRGCCLHFRRPFARGWRARKERLPWLRRPHPVDRVPPIYQLLPLSLQHVLVMYAGAVAVPLIIGRALKLPPEQVAFLISADLFAGGLATLVQSLGLPGVGIRLPIMMGVTFASVSPMLSIALQPDMGLLAVYGAVIAAGRVRRARRALHAQAAAVLSAGGHGHHHPGDRHLADAGRHQLGGRCLPTLTKVFDGCRPACPTLLTASCAGLASPCSCSS